MKKKYVNLCQNLIHKFVFKIYFSLCTDNIEKKNVQMIAIRMNRMINISIRIHLEKFQMALLASEYHTMNLANRKIGNAYNQ